MASESIEHDVTNFYGKLLHCATNSGKMRWNAICEDLVSIYEHEFNNQKRLIDLRELWEILFEPHLHSEKHKKKLQAIFKDEKHRDFFMKKIFVGLEDPVGWPEWISHFRY